MVARYDNTQTLNYGIGQKIGHLNKSPANDEVSDCEAPMIDKGTETLQRAGPT